MIASLMKGSSRASPHAPWGAVALVVAIGITIGLLASLDAEPFDDAYITFTFARHLAAGDGFVWVAGDPPVYGSTSLAFTALCAIASGLGLDLARFAMAIGAIGWALAAGCLVRLLWRDPGPVPALLAGLLVATLVVQSRLSQGLEVGLFAAAVLATFDAFAAHGPRRAGLCAALALLLRPEALLLFPMIAAGAFLARIRDQDARLVSSEVSRALVPGLAMAGSQLLACTLYFGTPLPQTMLAKLHFPCGISGCVTPGAALGYLGDALGWPGRWLMAGALVGALRSVRSWARGERLFLLWPFLLLALDALAHAPNSPWYTAQLLPMLAASAIVGVWPPSSRPQLAPLRLLAALGLVWFGAVAVEEIRHDPFGRGALAIPQKRRLSEVIQARMLQKNQKTARVWAFEVGYLGWTIPGRVDDLLGLVSPDFQPCLSDRSPDAFLDSMRPDYVVTVDIPQFEGTGCLLRSERFQHDYVRFYGQPREGAIQDVIWERRLDSAPDVIEPSSSPTAP